MGSDALSAGLRVCAKLCTDRPFEFELAEQHFNTALEHRVVCNDICEVRAPYFYRFLHAEQSHQKVPLVMHKARAHA